ncbi:MAG TPA: hypothetical protein VM889_00860 [Candidatus Thermoplasmatota archaeon]|nr:hypothetical protein [Candidatus Thermoplasmatota archaeon]
MRDTPPPVVLAAAGAALLVALLDVADTAILATTGAPTGPVVGTFVRDAVLVVAAVFLLRRARWALWTLVALLALGLLRTFSADEPLEYAGVIVALAGLASALMPETRAWVARPA